MSEIGKSVSARGSSRAGGRWSLLAFAALPLAVLHVAMLLERATHRDTIDATVVARWSLALVLLLCLRRAKVQTASMRRPTAVVGAVLIFALIHAPVAAPDPALPLAATGIGLTLSLALLHPGRTRITAPIRAPGLVVAPPSDGDLGGVLEILKDRAPPAAA